MPQENEPEYRPPTPTARNFVRLLVGFGVGVGVGLAPFLGLVDVPGFRSLLSLYPNEVQYTLIPLAAFVMGIVAVVIQWYSQREIPRDVLHRTFKRTLLVASFGVIALLTIYSLFAEQIPIEQNKAFVTVIVPWERTPICPCPTSMSNVDCISRLTLAAAQNSTCWEKRSVKILLLVLSLTYLISTVGLAALVGLLVIRRGEAAAPSER